MKPAPFDYCRPSTLHEALALLAARPGSARALAGGQSLVPMLNLRLAAIDLLVDLGRIAQLREVVTEAKRVRYGALVPHADFEDGRVPDAADGLLRTVGGAIAYRAVRTRGTIGGSIALCDPAADWLPALLALDATVSVAAPEGTREIALQSFVIGAYQTVLGDSELILSVNVPKLAPQARWGRAKVTRKTGEYADAMAVCVLDRSRSHARLVSGAIGNLPLMLVATAEAALRGEPLARIRACAHEEIAARLPMLEAHAVGLHAVTAARAVAQALR